MNAAHVRRATVVLLLSFLFASAGADGTATLVDSVCPIHAPIVWRNSSNGQNKGWLMDGAAKSADASLPTIANLNWKVQGVGDFNGDGQGDVFFRNISTGQNIGWLMNGLVVSVSAFLPTEATTAWNVVAVGDLNGDGKSDLVWRNSSSGQNMAWLMNGLAVSSSGFLPTIADTNWKVQGSGDFNADGRSDVFFRNTSTGQNIGWLMNGLVVSVSAFVTAEEDTDWNVVGVGDVSGDGKADLVWRNSSSGQNKGWLMNGLSVTTSAFLPTIADTNWKVVGVAELNRDGKADVVFRNSSTGQNIGWLMNGLVVSVSAFLANEADTDWAIVGVFGTTAKPTITDVEPNAGSEFGGQSITISGLYQNCATSVTVGGTAATIATTDFGAITATTGAHAPGTVDVVVTTSRGSTTSAGAYTYLPFLPPASFAAAATSTSAVALKWSAVAGATSYEVFRSSLNTPYILVATVGGTATSDPGLSANTTYLYKVRAVAPGSVSAFTAIDPATTTIFTDPTLNGVTIQAVHILQLRTAVDAMRAAAGLAAGSYTDSTLTAQSTVIKQMHLNDLRAALDSARSSLGLPALVYTDTIITPGSTMMKAAHLTELRNGTQ